MIDYISLLPVAAILLYLLFILLKPKSEADLFFELHRKTGEANLLQRIGLLEKRHSADYSAEKEKIRRYFADGRLTDKEVEFLENIMTRAFFNGFKKRWAVYREADPFSRMVFVILVVSGFLLVALVVAHIGSKSPTMIALLPGLFAALVLFPFTYVVVLTQVGVLSLLLSILRFIFPNRGALTRATVLSEEFIRALKPGGRSTEVVLPRRGRFTNFMPWV